MAGRVKKETIDEPTPGRLLSWPEVKARIPLSRAKVWILRRRGSFRGRRHRKRRRQSNAIAARSVDDADGV
jgi:hypothetical protein